MPSKSVITTACSVSFIASRMDCTTLLIFVFLLLRAASCSCHFFLRRNVCTYNTLIGGKRYRRVCYVSHTPYAEIRTERTRFIYYLVSWDEEIDIYMFVCFSSVDIFFERGTKS